MTEKNDRQAKHLQKLKCKTTLGTPKVYEYFQAELPNSNLKTVQIYLKLCGMEGDLFWFNLEGSLAYLEYCPTVASC